MSALSNRYSMRTLPVYGCVLFLSALPTVSLGTTAELPLLAMNAMSGHWAGLCEAPPTYTVAVQMDLVDAGDGDIAIGIWFGGNTRVLQDTLPVYRLSVAKGAVTIAAADGRRGVWESLHLRGKGMGVIARASPATQGFGLQAPGFRLQASGSRFSGREWRSASPWPEGDRRIVQQGGRDLRRASYPTDVLSRSDSGPPTQSRAPRSGIGDSPSSTFGPSLRRCSSGPRRLPAGSVLAATLDQIVCHGEDLELCWISTHAPTP
jgi:hypothetical protein